MEESMHLHGNGSKSTMRHSIYGTRKWNGYYVTNVAIAVTDFEGYKSL
jgi:hypothetical protein